MSSERFCLILRELVFDWSALLIVALSDVSVRNVHFTILHIMSGPVEETRLSEKPYENWSINHAVVAAVCKDQFDHMHFYVTFIIMVDLCGAWTENSASS